MSANRTKLIVIVCLSLFLVGIVCILGYTRIRSSFNMLEVYSKGLAPVRSLTLTIQLSQRDQFFGQLQTFAEKHGFETEMTDYNTNGKRFLFWMSKDDIKITASDVPPDPTLVYILFYAGYPGTPIAEDTVDEVDELVTDLISFIVEIPNVTISEEK